MGEEENPTPRTKGGLVKRTGPTNPLLKELIRDLNRYKTKLWKDVAKRLERPSRRRARVNVAKFQRYCKDGEKIVVPGKVLGYGAIMKKVEVGAFQFSRDAKRKIEEAGGKVLELKEFAEKYKDGKGIRIME